MWAGLRIGARPGLGRRELGQQLVQTVLDPFSGDAGEPDLLPELAVMSGPPLSCRAGAIKCE